MGDTIIVDNEYERAHQALVADPVIWELAKQLRESGIPKSDCVSSDGRPTHDFTMYSLHRYTKACEDNRRRLVDCHIGGPAEAIVELAYPPPREEAAATPLEKLELGTKITNALDRDGVATAGDLAERSEWELLDIRGVAHKSIAEIKHRLWVLGLELAPNKTPYPEHEKQAAVRDQTQPAGEFLEWLGTGRIVLAQVGDDGQLYQVYDRAEELLARWKGIDLKVLEQEKEAMLSAVRADLADAGDDARQDPPLAARHASDQDKDPTEPTESAPQ